MTQREQKCQLKLYFSGKGEPKLERTEFNNPQRPDLNDDPNQPKRTAYGSKPEGKTGSGQNLFSFQQLAIALCILLIKFKLKEHGAEELLATEASPGSSIRNALSGQDSKKSVALRAIFGEYGDLLESYPDRVKLIAKRLPAENIQVFCDERTAARKKILWIVNKLEEQ